MEWWKSPPADSNISAVSFENSHFNIVSFCPQFVCADLPLETNYPLPVCMLNQILCQNQAISCFALLFSWMIISVALWDCLFSLTLAGCFSHFEFFIISVYPLSLFFLHYVFIFRSTTDHSPSCFFPYIHVYSHSLANLLLWHLHSSCRDNDINQIGPVLPLERKCY